MTNITEAMHYANIQEKMALLGITDESVAKKAQEIGLVTAEEQKKAEEALWQESIMGASHFLFSEQKLIH